MVEPLELEAEIARWREYVARAPAVDGRDVEELEAHLRDQIADLDAAGLAADEAFLIAVKRMGRLDDIAGEFAREHSGRLWRQLVIGADGREGEAAADWMPAIAVAMVAAVIAQVVRVAADFPNHEPVWLGRNVGLFVLPCLAGYFTWRRRLPARAIWITGGVFVAAAVIVNAYPYDVDSSTDILVAAHLPVLLWFVVAFPYMSGQLHAHERRMDFVRFTGEWCIYYVLIALGGGVLTGLTALILDPIDHNLPDRVAELLLPSGGAGAVIVVAWLVESKQRVIENMAPVLTMLFTPLVAAVLAVAAVAYAVSGWGGAFDRELLGVFDALMVVVLGLVLYGLSAREPSQSPNWMDRIQLIAVLSALLLDVMVLGAMAVRVGDLGFTPNRAAALGLNLVLLVNLAGSAWLSAKFLQRREPLHKLERWQTAYLPVFAAWAAVVVMVLPPAFAFS